MAQTPVSKIGWPARVRVQLLLLPPMEDDLAVARTPVANRMDRKVGVRLPLLPRRKQMSSSADSVIVEVRAAEGGADAKLLVLEQVKIYLRLCARRSL